MKTKRVLGGASLLEATASPLERSARWQMLSMERNSAPMASVISTRLFLVIIYSPLLVEDEQGKDRSIRYL
jgi:hypothetical protein